MATYIALLRGINVGGARSLKMAALRDVIEACGAADVRTYIQSGNAVFGHPARSEAALQQALEKAIAKATGFPVPVVLRTEQQMKKVIEGNPLKHADEQKLHVTFFAGAVAKGALSSIDRGAFLPEEFAVTANDLYMHLPNGMGRSKLAALLSRKLPEGTTRNWKTVNTLLEMAQS